MTEYKPRSAWTSTSRGGARLTGTKLQGIVWHWPGTSRDVIGVESESATANRLRGYRNYHVNTRGWSDIGYNHAIDQAGRVWDLRGLGRVGAHCASTSNPDANHEWMGVLLILGRSERPSAAMIQACRDFRHDVFLERWPGRDDMTGHGRAPGVPGAQTSCPGSQVAELIVDGTFAQTGATVSLQDEYPPQSDYEKNIIPDGWADEGHRYLIKAAGALAWLKEKQFAKPFWPDETISLTGAIRWLHSRSRKAEPQIDTIEERTAVILDKLNGADTQQILDRIDQRHAEAAAQRQANADKLDAVLDLLDQHADGSLDAEAVVARMGELLAATASDDG